MSDRLEELGGRVKEGIGEVTGNERLEAEGKVEATHARVRRQAKGAMRQAGGAVKQAVGKVAGNAQLEAEGQAEQRRGTGERAG